MNEKIKEVDRQLKITATNIVAERDTIGKTNEMIKTEIKSVELLLRGLCELYYLAH